MENKDYLAKTDWTLLIDHSNHVQIFSEKLYQDLSLDNTKISRNTNDQIIKSIKYSSLLHDIGKMFGKIQQFYRTNKHVGFDYSDVEKNKFFTHNQLGYVFCLYNLDFKDELINELVLDAIYFHHGIHPTKHFNNKGKKILCTEIYNLLSNEEKQQMRDFVVRLGLGQFLITEKTYKDKTVPDYFKEPEDGKDDNYRKIVVRSILVHADRETSKLEYENNFNVEVIDEYIRNFNKLSHDLVFNPENVNIDMERFINQKNVADQIKTKDYNVLQATTGFGKTITSLLSVNKKTIYVCPRNEVSESVYSGIIKELKTFNINNVKVGLYFSGEVKEKNFEINDNDDFDLFKDVDILVTNIDNFLKPTIDNSKFGDMYTLLKYNVVFDEFHELVTEKALFGLFIHILNTKVNFTNSNTLLISATPYYFDTIRHIKKPINFEYNVLPKKYEHYKAQHDKTYTFSVYDGVTSEDIKNMMGDEKRMLFVTNTIARTQLNKLYIDNDGLVYHSKFENDDKKQIRDRIIAGFSKENNGENINVLGASIIKSSLDISFNKLYVSFINFKDLIQTMGRLNRWGLLENAEVIAIRFARNDNFNRENTGEIDTIVQELYKKELHNKEFSFLSCNFDKKTLTLDEIYKLYNQVQSQNTSLIDEFLEDKLRDSYTDLQKIIPIKYFKGKSVSELKKKSKQSFTAGSNKLRSNGAEIFVIYGYDKVKNGKMYTEVFTQDFKGDIETDFNKSYDGYRDKNNKVINLLYHVKNNSNYFQNFDLSKLVSLKKETKVFKNSETPLLDMDYVYTNEYGVIKKEIYNTNEKVNN